MTKEECFHLGYITKHISKHGELTFFLEVDEPSRYNKLQSVFVELNGTLVPFFINKIQIKGTNAVVNMEGIDNIEKAEELLKSNLYLPLSFLPPLAGKRFYFHEIPGFTVIDKTYGNIGTVEQVLDFPHQAVFQIKHGENEILIPAEEKFIININRTTKTLELDAPEGLIDIYIKKE